LGKGALDTWRLSWPYSGRLDKTGVTPRQVKRRGWRQTKMAGLYTDQRLNLSKLGKGCGRKPKPDPGNLAVRHYRGASGIVSGGTVNPSCNRKSRNGIPP